MKTPQIMRNQSDSTAYENYAMTEGNYPWIKVAVGKLNCINIGIRFDQNQKLQNKNYYEFKLII